MISCRSDIECTQIECGSIVNTLDMSRVQNLSTSTSCWSVARTDIGSGAHSTEQTNAVSHSDDSLRICIT